MNREEFEDKFYKELCRYLLVISCLEFDFIVVLIICLIIIFIHFIHIF